MFELHVVRLPGLVALARLFFVSQGGEFKVTINSLIDVDVFWYKGIALELLSKYIIKNLLQQKSDTTVNRRVMARFMIDGCWGLGVNE